MIQTAKTWDRASLVNTGKGALIAMGGALVPFILSNIPTIAAAFHLSPELAAAIGALASIAINAVHQYQKGAAADSSAGTSPEVASIVQDLTEQVKTEAAQDQAEK